MAKALYGYATGVDHRVADRIQAQNRLLRQRIADLELVVIRLQAENDRLRAATDEVLEPA